MTMPGLSVFKSLSAALSAGYQVYDKTPTGFLVRIQTRSGWAMALVEV